STRSKLQSLKIVAGIWALNAPVLKEPLTPVIFCATKQGGSMKRSCSPPSRAKSGMVKSKSKLNSQSPVLSDSKSSLHQLNHGKVNPSMLNSTGRIPNPLTFSGLSTPNSNSSHESSGNFKPEGVRLTSVTGSFQWSSAGICSDAFR